MNRRCNCICGDVSLVLIASLGLSLGLAGKSFGQCSNDAGSGDLAENEACPLDENDDTTNGGCNSTFPVFSNVPALPTTFCGSASDHNNTATCDVDTDCPDGNCVGDPNPGDGNAEGTCVGASEPSVNRRDTDWYLISQATLTAADTDGNGTVQITSAVTGEPGLDLVTFLITIDNTVDCNATVLNSVGCWDSTGGGGQTIASEVITISENPSGVIVFVSPGVCSGGGIFDGFECSTGINDYIVTIAADASFEDGTFTGCGDPALNPDLGPCNEANPNVPGCEDPQCCKIVCGPDGFNPLCCQISPGWIQQCAAAAVDLGCAAEPGGPLCMRTGSDDTVENYLAVCSDPYGAWTSDGFGGDSADDPLWGDDYNPIGADATLEASFAVGFFLFDAAASQRELLSNSLDWQNVFDPDASLERTIIGEGSVEFDDDNNGETDRLESTFVVTGAGKDLQFDLTQTIGQITPLGGSEVAVVTQTYNVTNNSGATANFVLVRHMDLDMTWVGTATDDSVGTGTNDNSSLGLYAFQGEVDHDTAYVTVATEVTGGDYYGSKQNIDPDGAGGGPAMGFGTDLQQWDSYGVPPGWENYVAGVGPNLDGESGSAPLPIPPATGNAGADASIGISIPVSLAGVGPSSTAQIVVTTTYGAKSPLGASVGGTPCPWDCQAAPEGTVGINDFLELLAQWTMIGTSCDQDGTPGVGINDFLDLLAAWGPCPE